MNSILQDFSYGLRGFRRQPAFAALAVLALALGIGATTTMFSVIDSVLLHPLPYVDAGRVVLLQIHDVTKNPDWWRGVYTVPEFLDYQEQNHVFDDVIGGGYDPVNYAGRDGAEYYRGSAMTANTFRLVRMPALLGRTLLAEDAKPGAPPVFLMSHKMWSKRFNLDPSVLGRTFVLNGTSRTLVGIMPARFTKLGADLWLPAVLDRSDPETKDKNYFLQAHFENRCYTSTSSGGSGRSGAPAGARLSQTLPAQVRGWPPDRQRLATWALPNHTLYSACRREFAAVDRLRQCGQHAVGAPQPARRKWPFGRRSARAAGD